MSISENDLIVSGEWIRHIPVLTYTDGDQNPKPLVIMSHGFTGRKEDLIPYLEELAGIGYYAVGIDNRLQIYKISCKIILGSAVCPNLRDDLQEVRCFFILF